MRRIVALVFLVLGCATARPEKMSWAEAMMPPPPTPSGKPADKRSDLQVDAALRAFIEASKVSRHTSSGEAMPGLQISAWSCVLNEVERFLERPVKQCAPLDAARARVVLESELEFDLQTYREVPQETKDAANAAMRRLNSRLNEVLALQKKPKVTPRRFTWPLSPVVVSSPYGDRVHPMTGAYQPHKGVDLAAPMGEPVRAAFSGTVVFAGWMGQHGKQVHLVHDMRWSTRYSHLSDWLVEEGDVVRKGQVIGFVGSTGLSTGPHLHFELVDRGDPVDPEEELPPLPSGSPTLAAR